ncbi:unnamed protein product, partial [marine sediment metagenome]
LLGLKAGTIWYNLAMVATITAGGMLISSIFPPPQPKSPDFDGDLSQSYSWSPATLQKQGIVIPRFYGKNRLYGNVISVSTEVDAADETKQNIRMLLALCKGPIKSIANIQINDQPIANYADIVTDTKLGLLGQSVITLDGVDMIAKPEYRPNRTVTNDGGPIEYITPDNDFDDLEIDLFFPRGIYWANEQGGISNHSIDIKIEIKPVGGAYSTLIITSIVANKTSPLWKTYKASVDYGAPGAPIAINNGTRYVVKVTKEATDEGARYGDELRLGGVREVINTKFIYPGTALLGVAAL